MDKYIVTTAQINSIVPLGIGSSFWPEPLRNSKVQQYMAVMKSLEKLGALGVLVVVVT